MTVRHFDGLPNLFNATRYHSLIVEDSSLPDGLEISAKSNDGLIMGLRHMRYPIEGVQFHPESILTENGLALIENFPGALENFILHQVSVRVQE